MIDSTSFYELREDGIYRLVPNDASDSEDDYGYWELVPPGELLAALDENERLRRLVGRLWRGAYVARTEYLAAIGKTDPLDDLSHSTTDD